MNGLGDVVDQMRKKKDVTEELSTQTGMTEKEVQKTLPKAASALRGAEVADATGADASSMAPSELKKLDPNASGKEEKKSSSEMSKEEILTMALMSTLPAMIGYAAGGAAGGAAGAHAGSQGISSLIQNKKDAETRAIALSKEKAEEDLKNRHISNEEKRSATDEMFKKGELANQSKRLALEYGGAAAKDKGKPLAAEQTDKLAAHDFALSSLGDLKQAILSNEGKMGPVAGRLWG